MAPGRLSILLGAVLLLGTGCTSADDPPVPFLQAFHHLETTRQKVHHLRTWHHELGAPNGLEQLTMRCRPSTSGALRLTPFGFAQDRLRTNGLPFVLSVAERSRSRDAGSRPA